jgi:O-antigen ligase
MIWVFGLLITALVIKDTAPLGDSYVLRGLSQGPALAVGLAWLFARGGLDLFRRYWLVLAYLSLLPLTLFVSRRPFFVGLQVVSLYAVVLFFVAFVEERRGERQSTVTPITIIAAIYTVVCLGSLALYLLAPGYAYETTLEGPRFRGLFGKSAMMGATAGLLLGFSFFGPWVWPLRLAGVAAGLPCLYLTGSRTFWVAGAVSLGGTAALYVKRKAVWITALSALALVLALAVLIGDARFSFENRSQIIRAQSLETLSGRTKIWAIAMDKFWDRPLLGYGFTAGGDAFESRTIETRALSAPVGLGPSWLMSLHNGYVQALLDSGALGASLYVAVMAAAFWGLLSRDRRKDYATQFYGLAFLAVANVGETIIFGAAVDYEVLYWYLVIFALSLDRLKEPAPVRAARPAAVTAPPARRYPLVSG